jgi:hypothetical protein
MQSFTTKKGGRLKTDRYCKSSSVIQMNTIIRYCLRVVLTLAVFSLIGCNSGNSSRSGEQANEEGETHEKVEFTLVNDTNRTITEFYVSAPDEEEWGDNLFASNESLEPGESAKVTIDDGREDCKYDLSAVFAGSSDGAVGEGSLEQTNVDICDGSTYSYVSK